MRSLHKLWFVTMAVLMVVVLVAACAPAPTAIPEEEADKVYVGFIFDMTGPYASYSAPIFNALIDVREYINEHGGIKGASLETVLYDCGGKVDLGVSQYMLLMEHKPKPVAVLCNVSSVAEALHDRLVEDDMLGYTVSAAETLYPRGNTFGCPGRGSAGLVFRGHPSPTK